MYNLLDPTTRTVNLYLILLMLINEDKVKNLFNLSFVIFSAMYLLHEKEGVIKIIMHKDSTGGDVLQAFMHALVMAHLVDKKSSLHLESQSWMDKHYREFFLKVSCHCQTFKSRMTN